MSNEHWALKNAKMGNFHFFYLKIVRNKFAKFITLIAQKSKWWNYNKNFKKFKAFLLTCKKSSIYILQEASKNCLLLFT